MIMRSPRGLPARSRAGPRGDMNPAMEAPATLKADLTALMAGAPDALARSATIYHAARDVSPVLDAGPAVLVTSHAAVREALRDPTRLSNRALVTGARVDAARASLADEPREAFDEVIDFEANFASRNDGEDHARLRRIAHRAFTPRKIAELEQATGRYVEEVLSSMESREIADGTELASAVPLMVVGDLLGVPAADRRLIHDWSVKLGAANASTEAQPMIEARQALREFRAYVAEMLAGHRDRPGQTDLITMLMGAEAQERVTEKELAALFVQLLFAGHETTATLIGAGLMELLSAPDQWRALVADPSLIPAAVEELLRLVSPSQFVSRCATSEVVLAGETIPAGDDVLLVLAAANRDPAVFAAPDQLDVRREDARHNVAFAIGPHFCLGAALARLEARVTFETLTARYPDVELAGGDPSWRGSAMLRRLTELPLSLGAPGAIAVP
jgi:cytochrome P450